jgi:hypothetical protein
MSLWFAPFDSHYLAYVRTSGTLPVLFWITKPNKNPWCKIQGLTYDEHHHRQRHSPQNRVLGRAAVVIAAISSLSTIIPQDRDHLPQLTHSSQKVHGFFRATQADPGRQGPQESAD